MNPWKLHSCLADEIQNFINLRRLSGTNYQSQAQLLGYFDRFLLDQHLSESRMTREVTDGYLQSLSHLAPRSRSNRFCVVRQLCQYLARNDPHGYVPEPLRVIPSQGAHSPTALLRFRRSWGPPLSSRPQTPFDLTPTGPFWDFSTAQGSGSGRPWP